ncbi:hypothetical protein ABEB36_005252 [Hypothenemus hampei]|uniref:Uncharacterized protein n=1 Tax=Hypothenemus hampei TaxID=57062 RepID=A0ABD1EXJ8_HYPHA
MKILKFLRIFMSNNKLASRQNYEIKNNNRQQPLSRNLINDNSARPIIYQSDNCKRSNSIKSIQIGEEKCRLKNNESENNNLDSKRAEIIQQENHNELDIATQEEDDEVCSVTSNSSSLTARCNKNDKNWDDLLVDRNHVNTLIDEMFASVLEVNSGASISTTSSTESIVKDHDNKITISTQKINAEDENLTVIIINNDQESVTPKSERKVKFNDQENHEFLIKELQNMKNHNSNEVGDEKIQMNDWYGINNKGKKVKMSSCHIQIEDSSNDSDFSEERNEKIMNISRAYQLPPLPKSLSGFKLLDPKTQKEPIVNFTDSKEEKSGGTNLDKQLAILRREMLSLREQDLHLLSKLWFLSESIHDFRQMMQEQEEEKMNLRLTPSPTPSSIDDEEYYVISTSNC